MSIDHYRNISFSAYIENACFNCTGKFSENVLRIFPHFHVDFFLPMWPLLSKPLCISMRRRKNVLFSTQSKNRSIWGPCKFLIFITKHLVKCVLFIYLSGNMKEFIWKKSGKVNNLYGNVKDCIRKMKTIWKNAEFD